MDVDNPTQKLNFDEYTSTPRKKTKSPPVSTNLEVFLRLRPRNKSVLSTATYQLSNENQSISLTSPNQSDIRNYTFNYIFDEQTNNSQVFDKLGQVAITRFLSGYSNLIFSYGITGSGKTHTIIGSTTMNGLIPCILSGLFNHNLIKNNHNQYNIFASYLENYTKDIYDLLLSHNNNNIHSHNKGLNIRVLPTGADIPDLTTIQITNTTQALQLIEFGNLKRSKAHTKLNMNSSRSHALFMLDLFDGNGVLKSQLCIVDLAGSESVKRTGFNPSDVRFNESCEINTSLSALGRCIESIQNGRSSIPWREVVLTKILYQYLTGNGYVSMIVNAHITNDDYNETMRALEFASNSQNITMNPVVNSTRASTRHKQRIFANNNNNNHITYINSLNNIEMLRKIAVEAYKTALKTRHTVMCLKNKKIKKIDMLFKLKQDGSKIESIQEETPEDIDMDDHEKKYKLLSQQMAQKEMQFEEKIAEINHLYAQIKHKDVEIQNFKANEGVLLDKIGGYKSVMNGSEQKMEKLTHTNRDLKEKLQGLHIEITEGKEKVEKLMDVMDKLKVEYKEKCTEFDRNIGVYEKINNDLEREILLANKCRLDRDGKYTQLMGEIKGKDLQIEALNRCNNELSRYKGDYDVKDKEFKQLLMEIAKLNRCKIEKENEINAKNAEINGKNEEIQQKNVEIQQKNDKIQHKNDEIDQQKGEISAKKEEIDGKNEEIQRRIDEIHQQTAEINVKNEKIDAQHGEIQHKMDLMRRQNEEINAKNVEINEKTAEINNKNKEIINLENMLEREKLGHNQRRDEELEREKEIESKNEQIHHQNEAILHLQDEKMKIQKETEKEVKSKNEQIINLENILKKEKLNNNNLMKRLNTEKNEEINKKNEEILNLKTLLANEKDINDKNNEKNKQILKFKKMLKTEKSTNNKSLNEKNEEIKNKNEQILKLENMLKKEKKMNNKNKEINNKNEEILNLKNMLNNITNEKETEINQKNQQINIKNQQINHQNEEILRLQNEKDTKINQQIDIKNQQINHQNEEILHLQNEKIKIQNEIEKEINMKNEQIINLENLLNQDKFTTNQKINKLNDEITSITTKLNTLNTEKNDWLAKYENLQLEYNSLKTIIHNMHSEFAKNKNNITHQLQTIENKIHNEFSTQINDQITSKNTIISEWKRKWSEIDMQNHSLNSELCALKSKYSQKCDYHVIALREADEEYIKQQNEISEWKRLTVELESKNKLLINKNDHENFEKDELQRQLTCLQEQLISLKLRSLPQSNASNKSSRKRQRKDMEQSIENDVVSNPNKKRKLTEHNLHNGVIGVTDHVDNDAVIMEENNNKSDSIEPHHLLHDLIPETPSQEVKISKSIPRSKSKLNRNLFSPALSHLSEGDEPLPKVCKRSVHTKKIKEKNTKKFRLMRTPATKQSKTMKSRYSQIANTPITKTGLRALRCVDLKQKLKKHDLKAYGKKENLVKTLFNHKNKENEESDSEEDMDYNWIGSPIKEMNGNKYYAGIIIDNIKYLIGGECFVSTDAEEAEDEAWMSQIVELFEDHTGEPCMGNMWYWKYGEIKKAIKMKRERRFDENEVFMSDGHAPDRNHIGLVITDKQFRVFENKDAMVRYGKDNKENDVEVFFSEYYYNQKKKQLIHRSEYANVNGGDKKPRAKNRRKKRS